MIIVDKSLESTSHTVQWLPIRQECPDDDRYFTEFFLMGTHNESEDGEPAQNSIMICSMNIPRLNEGIEFYEKEEEIKKKLSKLQVVKTLDHPQDVSKARAMFDNPNIVASFTNTGDINLYDFGKMQLTLALKGHESYGFGLNWMPNMNGEPTNRIVSGGTDSKVAVWDINKKPHALGQVEALNILTFHEKSVNGVDVLSTNTNIFASVSDDSKFALWDMCDLTRPAQAIQASPDGLNAIAFCKHDENTFLTGGQESGEIWLWDMRKLIDMKPLSSLSGHSLSVTNISFSTLNKNIFCSGSLIPDESDSKTASNYGVIVWDITKIGEERFDNQEEVSILSHDGHESTVDDISWSPYDERTLATVDGNKSINVFQISEELFMSPLHYENEFEK